MFNLPVDYGMELVLKAREKEMERLAWEMWLTLDGENKNRNPFGEFLQKFKQPLSEKQDKRSDDEIIQDAEYIISLLKRSE